MVLSIMGLQSLGIMMGVMITVVGVVSSLSKKRRWSFEKLQRHALETELHVARENSWGVAELWLTF
jgi:hypothetical protein